jgi:hypothetical protein
VNTGNRAILVRIAIVWVVIVFAIVGMIVWPYVVGFVLYRPPRIGETAQSLHERLGDPTYDSWDDGDLNRRQPRRLGYASPDGRRFLVTLNERDLVVELRISSR